jgi:hypothetical protein
MKNTLLLASLFVISALTAEAQKLRGLDKSPMDMAYYPDNFAHDRKFSPKPEWNDKALARVTYSRPNKKDREVFGKLIPYGKVWRAGANENSEIKFYTDVTIQGKKVKAGVYSLFVIPNETEWTIILNSDADQWGAYNYKEDKDVVRFTVPVKNVEEMVENFTIQFKQAADKLNESVLVFAWDKTMVELPVLF